LYGGKAFLACEVSWAWQEGLAVNAHAENVIRDALFARTREKAHLDGDGRTFEEIAEQRHQEAKGNAA
jgi:hypothetical protein